MGPNFLSQPWVLMVFGLLLGIVAVIINYLVRKKKRKDLKASYKDIDLAIPVSRRSDLVFGFYSSLSGTYEAVRDQVNLFWHSNFFGDDEFVRILKDTHCKVVLDLARWLSIPVDVTPSYVKTLIKLKVFKDSKRRYSSAFNEAGVADLRAFFQRLQIEGVLDKITYLYPKDEPNLFAANEQEHLKMIQATKQLKAEFPELANSRLACIYGKGRPFWNLSEYDVVGVDDYDQKSQSLTVGEHARLLGQKAAHQKTMLIPGPAFGHIPDPWVAYALLHPDEVEMIAAFLWFDDPNHKDVPYTGLQAMPEDFKQWWKGAANICLNRA